MIVVIKTGTSVQEIQRISQELQRLNVTPVQIVGIQKVVIGLVGDTATINPQQIQQISPAYDELMQQMSAMSQTVGRLSQNFLNNRIMMNETHTATFKNFMEERGFSHANRTTEWSK